MPRPESSLKREVGLFQLVTYGIGNIVGAGIYVLVGDASGLAGNAVWLAFLVGAVVALFTGLAYAELGSMYPRAASEYVYLGRAYGNRLIAFLTEWTMLMTEIVAAAAVAIGFAGYLSSVLPILPVVPLAVALIVALTLVSLGGIKGSLRLNTILSLVAIGGLVVVVVVGIPAMTRHSAGYTSSPSGIFGVLGASALVFFSYIGFDNISNLSEETKRPEKTIPRGLLISLAVSTLLYVLVGVAVVSLAPWQSLSSSDAPLAYAVSLSRLGGTASSILTVAALFTTVNTVLVLLIVSSRIMYGMARENVMPRVLGRITAKSGAPYAASVLVMLVALVFVPLGSVAIVAKVTSFGSLLTFAMINVAMLHLRRVAPHLKRPFKSPLNVGWFPVTALLGIISCLLLLTQFDFLSVLLGLVLPISACVLYAVMSRRKGNAFGIDISLHERHEQEGETARK